MGRLDGKVAVNTGGAGVIGSTVGKLFAKEGAKVVLVDMLEDNLKKVVESIDNENLSYAVADVTKEEETKKYIASTVGKYGRLDACVLNAGIEGKIVPITDLELDDFKKVLEVNIFGVMLGIKHAVSEMQKNNNGSIVITSSNSGTQGWAGGAGYVTSKHGIIGLMKVAAIECVPLGIRVNTVNPSATESRMMRSIENQADPDAPDKVKESIEAINPMKRYAKPEEIANMILFLASDESSYCNGGCYTVDGGVTAGPAV
jgi:NAD(P)-dependent dehydrogenase (short-subunit alcohol dehydrogenase family)